jgi:tight adherence protein B
LSILWIFDAKDFDMSAVILFALLLIVSFGVVLYFLKPSSAEGDIQRHLAGIDRYFSTTAEGSTILKKERLSANQGLNDFISRIPGSFSILHLIKQAGSKWRVAPLVFGSLLAALAGGWLASEWISSLGVCICVGAVLGLSPYVYLYFKREARFRQFCAELPSAIDLMARALRVGHAVSAMLEMVGQESAEPLASEFRTVYEEQALGLPLREAMLNLVQRVPLDDVRFLATAVVLQKETGGNLAEVLDKTAIVMRERIRLRGQLRVYTAQGRVTGWVLCALPFIMFGLISAVNPGYEKAMLADPLGLHLIYAGLVMMVIGILVIRKIIDIRV